MAMLAGPRRKQKVINLRAKNNAWSNDTSKFGQRMLEKMGWSTGKGLGAKENGIVEHVVARYKNDDKGLGFEDKNDQWTKHEDDFNALLANLSNADDNKEILHSGVSLETKSKKSKARIHYHKFTRGKDLSRYSEKDLANIFGKKSFKEEKEVVAKDILKEDVRTSEQIFTEKGNMDDYFKQKMAAFKSKSKILETDNKELTEDLPDYAFQGFSFSQKNSSECENKNSYENQSFSFYSQKSESHEDKSQPCVIEEDTTKKKKKKKSKNKEKIDYEENGSVSEENQLNNSDNQTKKKTKKKEFQEQNEPELQECNEIKKRKKKKKDKEQEEIIENLQEQGMECVEDYVTKKKKKRKNKDL